MFSNDFDTSSQGVVASKLAKAVELLFVVCEQAFIVRHNVMRLKGRNDFIFLIELFSNVQIAIKVTK
jgi:hypothetical protein